MPRFWVGVPSGANAVPGIDLFRGFLDDSKQKQNKYDQEDQAEAASAVIPDSGAHTVTSVSKAEDQDY